MFALVDDEDYEELSKYKWHAHPMRKIYYAARSDLRQDGQNRKILMHRQILGIKDRLFLTDHENGNGLDNQRHNLRICTTSQNGFNRDAGKNKLVPIKGIYKTANGKWTARICQNRKGMHIGTFSTAEEAARAYNEKAKELHGDFAKFIKI